MTVWDAPDGLFALQGLGFRVYGFMGLGFIYGYLWLNPKYIAGNSHKGMHTYEAKSRRTCAGSKAPLRVTT